MKVLTIAPAKVRHGGVRLQGEHVVAGGLRDPGAGRLGIWPVARTAWDKDPTIRGEGYVFDA